MKIKDYILNHSNYKVDFNYQRPKDAWSMQDKQCLIDSILSNDPVPMFFINLKGKDRYIVDGQQRLGVIKDFHDQKIKLSERFSGKPLDGKRFGELNDKLQEKFLNYDLSIRYVEGDDEKIRSIFSRLQRGKPLFLGERLNAMPGNIVSLMRKFAKHSFIAKSININQDRYGAYPDVIRLLFFEINGPREASSNQLYEFMGQYKDIDARHPAVKSLKSNLDFLRKCFSENNLAFLEKHAWVLTVYSLISSLKKDYVIKGYEKKIRKFVEEFHNRCYDPDLRRSNQEYQIFYDNIRGGWSERIIFTRLEIIKDMLIKDLKLRPKDSKRQISNEEKILAFGRNPFCETCGKRFKDYKEAQYHHKTLHSKGGHTKLNNIMILCKKCHNNIHSAGTDDIESNDFEEVDV